MSRLRGSNAVADGYRTLRVTVQARRGRSVVTVTGELCGSNARAFAARSGEAIGHDPSLPLAAGLVG